MHKYDSTADTLQHIRKVSKYLGDFAQEMIQRGSIHDESKLHAPEKELFDEMTPLLSSLVYDSPEYKESLLKLNVALDHHYLVNSHHPQHYENGVDGMNLMDLVEMFYDWKAATERTSNGNISTSVDKNAERFNLSPQLVNIFKNTIKNHNW
jgi:hypothetical protein